jgi:hypothetical protein
MNAGCGLARHLGELLRLGDGLRVDGERHVQQVIVRDAEDLRDQVGWYAGSRSEFRVKVRVRVRGPKLTCVIRLG